MKYGQRLCADLGKQVGKCSSFDIFEPAGGRTGLVFVVRPQLLSGVPDSRRKRELVKDMLEQIAAALSITVSPEISLSPNQSVSLYFSSLRQYRLNQDQPGCLEQVSSIVGSIRRILETASTQQRRNSFELSQSLLCLEGRRLLLVSLPLLSRQTEEQQLAALRRMLQLIDASTVREKILLKKSERCQSLSEIEQEVAYFSRLKLIGRNKSPPNAEHRQTTRRTHHNLFSHLSRASTFRKHSPAIPGASATLHQAAQIHTPQRHSGHSNQPRFSGERLLHELSLKRLTKIQQSSLRVPFSTQPAEASRVLQNNWVANPKHSCSAVLNRSVSPQFKISIQPLKPKLGIWANQTSVVINPNEARTEAQLQSQKLHHNKPASVKLLPPSFDSEAESRPETRKSGRARKAQYQQRADQVGQVSSIKEGNQSEDSGKGKGQGIGVENMDDKRAPVKQASKTRLPSATATSGQDCSRTVMKQKSSCASSGEGALPIPHAQEISSLPKEVEALNKRLDAINILGETVSVASSLFKTLPGNVFWQLPLFFLYKHFFELRSAFVEELQERTCMASQVLRGPFAALAQQNVPINADIERSLRKMLVVVLNRLKVDKYDEFDVSSYLNLNFTHSYEEVSLKLVYNHMSAVLSLHRRKQQVAKYAVRLMDCLLLVHRKLDLDAHKKALVAKDELLYEELNSRIDQVEQLLK